jgi:hypothetical protein
VKEGLGFLVVRGLATVGSVLPRTFNTLQPNGCRADIRASATISKRARSLGVGEKEECEY